MPKKARELSALEVKRLPPGDHAVGGVAGLTLQHRDTGARSWLLRIRIAGKRHELGLGPYPEVPVARARELARDLAQRARSKEGATILAERREAKAKVITFREAAEEWWKTKQHEIEEKQRKRYWSLLEIHVLPVLGPKNVADITMADCLSVLENLWTTKTETATRARERIDAVLTFALAKGWRSTPSPAVWKGGLAAVLPAPSRVAKVRHHPALAIDEAPDWWAALRQRDGESARALELLALTTVRSSELRGMRWGELDLDAALWVVPAERMKPQNGQRKEHRVPLSALAAELLKDRKPEHVKPGDLVFAAPRMGPLSDMALSMLMRRMSKDRTKETGTGWLDPRSGRPAVPHGMRSTFRDWAAECTDHPDWIAEMALAHTVGSGVERAYRRGEALEKRRALMEDWAEFVSGGWVNPASRTPRAPRGD